MRQTRAVLFFAASLALVACSEDDPDVPYTMPPGSGALAGDAATGSVSGMDSGPSNPLGGGSSGGPGQISQPGMAGGTTGGGAGTGGTTGGGTTGGTGGTGDGGVPPTGDGGGPVVSSGDPDFDACYAKVKPVCLAKEQSTAELIEQPCKALTNLPIPLTNGMSYGPTTVMGGPYAAKIDWNEGAGTPFVGQDNELLEQVCLLGGIDTFGEPAEVTDELKNLRGLDWKLFTIFRPACMKKGEKYPVITWANGTCGETHGYSALLSNLASHGFIVIASNSTWTAATTTAANTPVQVSAIDYAEALNADMNSPLYQRLDLSKVGAMGHSQGAGATGPTAADPRVKAVIFWNTGTSNDKPFLNISGDKDVGGGSAAALKSSTDGASKPGAWVYFHKIPTTTGTSTGHLTLMMQPERVTDLNVAWWKWQLKGDQEAKKMFVGSDCGLCKSPADYEYGVNPMLQ